MDPVKFFLVKVFCRGADQAKGLWLGRQLRRCPFAGGAAQQAGRPASGCTSSRFGRSTSIGATVGKRLGGGGAGLSLAGRFMRRHPRPPAPLPLPADGGRKSAGSRRPLIWAGDLCRLGPGLRGQHAGARGLTLWTRCSITMSYARDVGKMGSIRPSCNTDQGDLRGCECLGGENPGA